jgi:hypothetical protein
MDQGPGVFRTIYSQPNSFKWEWNMFSDTKDYKKFKNVDKTTKYGITSIFTIKNYFVLGGSIGPDASSGKV